MRSAAVLVFIVTLFLGAPKPSLAQVVTGYSVYQPEIERGYIYNHVYGAFKYNHDSSVAWFRDRWFAAWNANTDPREGAPGQINVVSTSFDFKNWSEPVAAFNDPDYSINPVDYEGAVQWQPNLVVVGDELWCVWSQNLGSAPGVYVSKLSDPNGKWENTRILFEVDAGPLAGLLPASQLVSENPIIRGKRWRLFPTQNPIVLSTGRVLAPVTAISNDVVEGVANLDGWWVTEKLSTVLYTDDGVTWHVSEGTQLKDKPWAAWEPTVWELPDGTVYMFYRNNDPRTVAEGGDPSHRMLLWSVSYDHGETWSPAEPLPLETIVSRMHVLPLENRYVMVHNDYRKSLMVEDRLNLALFFSRAGTLDFLPGIGISGRENQVAYPQMFVKDDALYLSYSMANSRSIRWAKVSPLPDPDAYYVYPRSNTLGLGLPLKENDALRFYGLERLGLTWQGRAQNDAVSLGAWVLVESPGVIFDSRTSGGTGLLVHTKLNLDGELVPIVNLRTREGDLYSSLPITPGEWTYLGVSIDNRARTVTFVVNDRSETVRYEGSSTLDLSRPVLGYKAVQESMVPGMNGMIRSLFILAGRSLSAAEHGEYRLGRRDTADFYLDAAGDWERYAEPAPARGQIQVDETVDGTLITLLGESSASVELPQHDAGEDRISLTFRFRMLEGSDRTMVATIGYADRPVRIATNRGTVALMSEHGRRNLGSYIPDDWNTLTIEVAGGVLTASVNGGEPASVPYEAPYVLAYLGDGYPSGLIPPDEGFTVDVGSIRGSVE